MPSIRFIQLSDLHLGAPCGWLPAARRDERRREQQRTLAAAVKHAIECRAHAILLAGDLFDSVGVDPDALAFAIHAFEIAGCPPTFIAPGNHDPWFPNSPAWSPRLLEARGLAWPEHVHVFTTAGWSVRALGDLPVEIWGRCYAAGGFSGERPLDSGALAHVPTEAGTLRIGLFHGSREGYCPPGQIVTAPFSDDEALGSPFAYLAVGHYHRAQRLAAADPTSVRLAYAGSSVALDATELGPHGALDIQIEMEGPTPRASVEAIELDRRRVHDLAVDVTGATSADEVDQRLGAALEQASVRAEDIATVRLRGRIARGIRYLSAGPELRDRFFHLRVDGREVRPDYDLDSYRDGANTTTEERFVRTLMDQLAAENDPEERAVIEDALYYGLDAFRMRQVTPVHEEAAS